MWPGEAFLEVLAVYMFGVRTWGRLLLLILPCCLGQILFRWRSVGCRTCRGLVFSKTNFTALYHGSKLGEPRPYRELASNACLGRCSFDCDKKWFSDTRHQESCELAESSDHCAAMLLQWYIEGEFFSGFACRMECRVAEGYWSAKADSSSSVFSFVEEENTFPDELQWRSFFGSQNRSREQRILDSTADPAWRAGGRVAEGRPTRWVPSTSVEASGRNQAGSNGLTFPRSRCLLRAVRKIDATRKSRGRLGSLSYVEAFFVCDFRRQVTSSRNGCLVFPVRYDRFLPADERGASHVYGHQKAVRIGATFASGGLGPPQNQPIIQAPTVDTSWLRGGIASPRMFTRGAAGQGCVRRRRRYQICTIVSRRPPASGLTLSSL